MLHNRGQTNTRTPSECHRTRARYLVRSIERVFLLYVSQEELRVYVCLRLAGCRIFCIVFLVFAHIYQLVASRYPQRYQRENHAVSYSVVLRRLCTPFARSGPISRVMLDLRRNPFVHGCLYVALSRVRHSSDIMIMSTPAKITAQGWARTANVVRQALLPDACT